MRRDPSLVDDWSTVVDISWRGLFSGRRTLGKRLESLPVIVGVGRRVNKGYKALKVGEQSVANAFPDVYMIALDTEASVSDHMRRRRAGLFWDVGQRSDPQHWEIDISEFLFTDVGKLEGARTV
ncbi:hypothetical protein U1Q18_039040 [Sarracenia purpurea var. burkii]